MKKQIFAIAEKCGISAVGICGAERYRRESVSHPAVFASNKGTLPPDAESIIVCAFSYYNGADRGNISRYAQGKDYHRVAIEKMNDIVNYLEENGYRAEAYADTGGLNERMLASLCGIAFRGKNHMMINDSMGSYFFIGYIITDCPLEPDSGKNRSCMDCGRCVKACPSGVLGKEPFDEKRCLSYITQRKGVLTPVEEKLITDTGFIWGCDICQEVCPHNKVINVRGIDVFKQDFIIDLYIPEDMSNREFKTLYRDRAFAWRGKNVLVRNQKIAESSKKI